MPVGLAGLHRCQMCEDLMFPRAFRRIYWCPVSTYFRHVAHWVAFHQGFPRFIPLGRRRQSCHRDMNFTGNMEKMTHFWACPLFCFHSTRVNASCCSTHFRCPCCQDHGTLDIQRNHTWLKQKPCTFVLAVGDKGSHSNFLTFLSNGVFCFSGSDHPRKRARDFPQVSFTPCTRTMRISSLPWRLTSTTSRTPVQTRNLLYPKFPRSWTGTG